MATGVDEIYPPENRNLAQRMLATGGALISEFPPGTPPRRENFPQRNRLISGLSLAVVVVEAKCRSGSLITARFAMEQGRANCALPGGAQDPVKQGCHELIREGATLVTSAVQVVESASSLLGVLQATDQPRTEATVPDRPKAVHPLLDCLGANSLGFDELMQMSGLGAAELAAQLGELELSRLVYRSPEGFSRTRR